MPSVAERLKDEPYAFDFFQAVRLLERMRPEASPLGRAVSPDAEVIRLRSHLSMAFPPSPVVDYEPPDEFRVVPRLTVAFLGLYGPSGVLPLHYTQLLLDLGRDVRGPERRSLRDWLDVFDHRLLSLYFRAWEKYCFYLPFERNRTSDAEPDTFSLALLSLIGLGSPGLQNRLAVRGTVDRTAKTDWHWDTGTSAPKSDAALAKIDDLALVYYGGFFAQRPHNASNLRAMLQDYFGLPIDVEPFRGQWLAIARENQTRLGGLGTLGSNAVAGDRVWDVQSRFRVRVGPLDYPQFEELLPDRSPTAARKTLFLLMQLARLFVGPDLDFDVQLVLAGPAVPEAKLEDTDGFGARLGWNVWLISEPPTAPVADAVFDAEWVTELA